MKRMLSSLICVAMSFACSLTAFAGGPLSEDDTLANENTESTAAVMTATSLPSGLSLGATYTIKSKASPSSTDYMLNFYGKNDYDKANIDVWKRDGSQDQRFRIISSNGGYKLEALSSSRRVLDAYRISGQLQNGCNADVWEDNDDAAQKLVFNKTASGYTICLESNPTLALTAESMTNGGNVKFATLNANANNQKWEFEKLDDYSSFYGGLGWTYPLFNNTPTRISAGYKGYDGHHGMDIPASEGTLVRSAAAGTVVVSYCSLNDTEDNSQNQGCGYAIAVKTNYKDPETGNELIYMYHHLCEAPKLANGTVLKEGAAIGKGVQVGKVGTTGNSTNNHLHMQVTRNGHWHHYKDYYNSINPILFYPNISFTGDDVVSLSIEDEPTVSSFIKGEPIESIMTDEHINKYIVDISIIEYIGEENFTSWLEETKKVKDDITLQDLLYDFSIDKPLFSKITKGSGFENAYNFDYIASNYTAELN